MVKTNVLIPVKYNTDFEEVRLNLLIILRGSDLVLLEPDIDIEVNSFGEDGFYIGIYAPCKAEDLETLTSWLNLKVYNELTKMGVKMGVKSKK
jgi:small-conductance mechanosensitive channel